MYLDASDRKDADDFSANLPEPGDYRHVIEEVETPNDQNSHSYVLSLRVLSGTVAGMEGRTLRERFYQRNNDGCINR